MTTMIRAGLGQNLVPRASSLLLTWMQGPKHLGWPLLLSKVHYQEAVLKVEQSGFKLVPIWDVSIAGGSLPYYMITVTLYFFPLWDLFIHLFIYFWARVTERETKRNVDLSSTGWWLLWLQEVDTGSDTVTSASDLAHPEQPRPHRINDGQRPTFLTLSRPKQGWCHTHDRKGVKPLWATQPDSPTCCPLLSCSSFHCMGERSRNRVLFAY